MGGIIRWGFGGFGFFLVLGSEGVCAWGNGNGNRNRNRNGVLGLKSGVLVGLVPF